MAGKPKKLRNLARDKLRLSI